MATSKYEKRRTYIHIDVPNLVRRGDSAKIIEFSDIDWPGLLAKMVEPETYLRAHIYTPRKYQHKYAEAAAKCGFDNETLFFSPYSNWKSDVDATLAANLMGISLRSLEKLPHDGDLHVIVISGDADFINAYKMLKELARAKGKKIRITVASWKDNLPLNRKILNTYVDQVIEIDP